MKSRSRPIPETATGNRQRETWRRPTVPSNCRTSLWSSPSRPSNPDQPGRHYRYLKFPQIIQYSNDHPCSFAAILPHAPRYRSDTNPSVTTVIRRDQQLIDLKSNRVQQEYAAGKTGSFNRNAANCANTPPNTALRDGRRNVDVVGCVPNRRGSGAELAHDKSTDRT